MGSGFGGNWTVVNASSPAICADYESTDLKIVSILRASVGSFSALCCLGVIAVILLYKKYGFFIQRQILYLAVAACVHSLSYPLSRVNYYTTRPILDPYCQFGGFFNLYTSWTEVFGICCITFYLFAKTVLKVKQPERIEPVCIIVMFLAPFSWTWVPFKYHAFGTAGGWCDIRILDENCSSFRLGKILRFTLWYGPFYVILLIIFICTITIYVRVRKTDRNYGGIYDPDTRGKKERLITEVKPLLWYPVVYLLLTVFSVTNRIVDTVHPDSQVIVLWYFHVLTSNFRGAFISLVYAFDPETRKHLRCIRLAAACKSCCQRQMVVREYDAQSSIGLTDSERTPLL